ncbi:MAG: nicotinate-nucleotide adenylyltransferase [Acidobacteriota bacterium]
MISDRRSRVGVFGGTFDPIHRGHVEPVRRAADRLRLDRVLYLPTARPPHKSRRLAPAWARFAMAELALLDDSRLWVSPLEMETDAPSFTIDTVERLRRERPEAHLFYLVGADSLRSLPSWRRWQDLLAAIEFVVLERPEAPLEHETLAPEVQQALEAGRIHRVDNPPIALASTDIRRRLARGSAPPASALDPRVLNYVQKYDLYREPTRAVPSMHREADGAGAGQPREEDATISTPESQIADQPPADGSTPDTSSSSEAGAGAAEAAEVLEAARRKPRHRSDDLASEAQAILAVAAALDRKAEDLKILELRDVSDFTDLFMIASGTNERQVKAIADAIVDRLRAHNVKPLHIEGHAAARWILLDFGGDMVAHVFHREARRFYDLERLWADAPDLTERLVAAAEDGAPSPEPAA